MLRHVIPPARFFSQVSNDIIRHPRLSSDAVRLLTWQLSLPLDAKESLSRTATRAGIKKGAFLRAKGQLKEEGYVHEWRQQGVRGLWSTVQLVSSVPLSAAEAAALRGGGVPVAAPTVTSPAAGRPTGRAAGRHPDNTPRECAGDGHMQPLLFHPVADEAMCPACREDHAALCGAAV